MTKKNKSDTELDEEFLAQIDFLRADYDAALQDLEMQKKDIQRLISILVEQDIPVPEDIMDRYVSRRKSDEEGLPFN